MTPELGKSLGEVNGYPLPMDRRAWQATVHGVTRELHYYTTGLTRILSVKKNYGVYLGIITF